MIDKFRAKYFSLGILGNYLVFILTKKYIKYFSGITRIELWKSNGMTEKSIENITKSGSNFAPTFVDDHILQDINFNWYCFVKNNVSTPKNLINLYISYTPCPQWRNLNTYFTLCNCLLGL